MMKLKHVLAASAAVLAVASPAAAQEYTGDFGTISAPPVTTDVGDPVVTQTGDNTVDPYQNTITTVQEQLVSTTGEGTEGVSTTINGITYNGFIEVSGAGTQSQTETLVRVDTYDPVTLAIIDTDITGPTLAPLGDPTVTAVSATGFVGAAPRYSSTLATSGEPDEDGAVVATENSSLLNSAGITFAQRVGTATYSPVTGEVTVALPTTPTSSTSISASGISTTGSISAASISTSALNMNGGRITNLGAGVAATDAVNVGQLNAAVTSINASISTLSGTVSNLSDLVDRNRKRAEAGIAVATALSGGMFLPDKRFNVTANVGAYRGEVAGAVQIGALVSDNVAINAGVATSFNSGGGTAVRGGFTFGF